MESVNRNLCYIINAIFFCITYLFCLIWVNTVDDRNNLNCDDESERLFITGISRNLELN